MRKTAAKRTDAMPVAWSVAKRRKHNISMIETPQVWMYVKINGVYTPYCVA